MPEVTAPQPGATASVPFDFRQSVQIPEAQLESIRILHEAFLRNLFASLALLLRTNVTGSLAGVEQTSFGELAEAIATPACSLYLSMQPQEGATLIDVSQSLVAPILDCVLGGNGKVDFGMDREITDIEQSMLDGVFALLAHQMREAWKPLAAIDFQFDGVETSPQASQRFAAKDPVLLLAADLHVAETDGRLQVAIPASILKLVRQKSEPRAEARKAISQSEEHAIQAKLAGGLQLDLECVLVGANIRLRDLLQLKDGDLLDTGIACESPATILVNGLPKFRGGVTVDGEKQAVVIQGAANAL